MATMILFVILVKTLRQHSFLFRTKYKVSFSFLPNGGGGGGGEGGKMRLYGLSGELVTYLCAKHVAN